MRSLFRLCSVRSIGLVATCALVFPAAAYAQAARAPHAPRAPRFAIAVNGGQQTKSSDFTITSTVKLNVEDENLASRYGMKSGAIFDVGGHVRLARHLWAGLAVSTFSKNSDAAVTAELPHPFFFNRLRTVEGTAPGLARKETAVHLQVLWALALTRQMELKIFAGPTFFNARQDVITDVNYAETYPFDSATYSSPKTESKSQSTVGYNAGADVGYYFTPAIGVGLLLRFSQGTIDLVVPNNGTASPKVGGFQVAGGARLRF